MTQVLFSHTTLWKYEKNKQIKKKKPGCFKLEKLPVHSVQTRQLTNIINFIVNTLLIEKTQLSNIY